MFMEGRDDVIDVHMDWRGTAAADVDVFVRRRRRRMNRYVMIMRTVMSIQVTAPKRAPIVTPDTVMVPREPMPNNFSSEVRAPANRFAENMKKKSYSSKHFIRPLNRKCCLTTFTSLAAPEVVVLTTSGVASDMNVVKMITFLYDTAKLLYLAVIFLRSTHNGSSSLTD